MIPQHPRCPKCGAKLLMDMLHPEHGYHYCWDCDMSTRDGIEIAYHVDIPTVYA